MRRRLRLPSPSMIVAMVALVVAMGGTSYAALSISGKDVRNNSLTSADVKNRSLKSVDFRRGQLPRGRRGAAGAQGPAGPAGPSRFVLVNERGEIEAQSGGFSVTAAYPVLPNTATNGTDNSMRANGNVYINAGEDLTNKGIVSTIALQNARDLNGDGVTNGRAGGADANPEFSGEITNSRMSADA